MVILYLILIVVVDYIQILLIGQKTKKVTINPISDGDKRFQYIATVALNHEELEMNSERISKIKPFINKYNWKGTNYPSEKGNYRKFEKNNLRISFNVLYEKEKKIWPAYISKYILFQNTSQTVKKKMILLMICR